MFSNKAKAVVVLKLYTQACHADFVVLKLNSVPVEVEFLKI